jgi:acid phosphatase
MCKRLLSALILVSSVILQLACSGTSSGGSSTTAPSAGSSSNPVVPTVSHVIVVVEENQSYDDVVGSENMPYFNSLIRSGGLATQFYADAHPSLPNYFMLTTGQTIAPDDTFTGVVSQNNVVRVLTAAGKTWHSYAESIPQAGYLGTDVVPYLRHHVPFTYFSDVQSSPAQAVNIVPFTQFSTDLTNNTLPNYAFIVPNSIDDGHDCPNEAAICANDEKLTDIDTWLQTNIDPLIKSAAFQDSLLIITFDEGDITDLQHGGGHVATVLLGPKVKAGYQSTSLYLHENTLRLTLKALGVSNLPGNAATATDMGEFF